MNKGVLAQSVFRIEEQLEKGNIDKNAYYDALTELVIQKTLRADSLCIDVGCHEGFFLEKMMKHAPEGVFLGFEPIPHLYDKLSRRFSQKNVYIFDCALSNVEGASSFNYVVSNPGYSGLIRRRYDRPHEEDVEITVQTKRLDSIMSQHEFGKIQFIKVDVEGAEYLVFEGARYQISLHKPVIVFEHGMGASDCYGKGPEDLFELLGNQCQMKISLISEWLLGGKVLDREAFCSEFYSCSNYYFVAHQ